MNEERPQILIACALKKEADPLRDAFRHREKILVTGMGPRRTQETLKRQFEKDRPQLLVFTGTGGQLDPSLALGDIVTPEAWYLEDGSCFPADPSVVRRLISQGIEVSGRGITVRAPVIRAQARHELHQRTGARICDMEAAAALEVAAAQGVPSIAVKIVSDSAESGIFAFWSHLERNMELLAVRLMEVLQALSERAGSPSGPIHGSAGSTTHQEDMVRRSSRPTSRR